jgi:hypothetical protein
MCISKKGFPAKNQVCTQILINCDRYVHKVRRGVTTDPFRQKNNFVPKSQLIVIDMYISKRGLATNSLLGKNQSCTQILIANSRHRNGEVVEEDMMNTTYSFCTQSFFPPP